VRGGAAIAATLERPTVAVWSIEQERHAELMDDPALPAADHMLALGALARINALSFTARHLAAAIARLVAGRPATRPLVVVDLACGGGDVTVDLACRLARMLPRPASGGPSVRVIGVDKSDRGLDRARDLAARRGCGDVEFQAGDLLADICPPCDVAVSSLFLHHLDDDEAAVVLSSMAGSARLGGVVSDLLRSRAGLALAVLGTTILSTSRVARVDGPLSVRAARTVAEYRDLLARAGLTHAHVRRIWPERCLIEWSSTGRSPAESDTA
jgi:SAM-dependent methyltransferase